MRKTFLLIVMWITSLASFAKTGHFIPSDFFSSGLISSICQDSQGSMWVGTDYGLNRYDGYHFSTYLHDAEDSTSLSVNVVVSLFCDRDGRLWVGTNRGLDRYDSERDIFIHYTFPDGYKPRVSTIIQRNDGTIIVGTAGYGAYAVDSNDRLYRFSLQDGGDYFSCMFEDTRGRMWKNGFDDMIYMRDGDRVEKFQSPLGNVQDYAERNGELFILTLHGLLVYRNGTIQVADVDMSCMADGDFVFSRMAVSNDGDIYIGTRGQGLYRIPALTPNKMEPVVIDAMGIDPQTAKIARIIFDRRGNLWLACHRKGLLMVPQRPMQFTSWDFANQGINLGSTISSVCEGDGDMMWCTVQGVGVYGFNGRGKVVAHPDSPDAVEFIFRDKMNRYWLGTDDGLFAYDPTTGRSQLRVTFDCDRFNDLTSDDQGRIYISTFSRGMCVYDPATGSLVNHNMYDVDSVRGYLCNNWIMGLQPDRQGLIWMATSSGVSCYDPHNDTFRSQGWNSVLDGIVCFDVCELRSGRLADGRQLSGSIAIGTEEGLFLYDRSTRRAERFPGSEQLNNKSISYIVQANNGDIWCSTSAGIWQYQLSSQSFIGHVYGNGLTQKEYLYGVGVHTDADRIYFGTAAGLTVFSPSQITESQPQLDPVQLSALLVGNTKVTAVTELNDVRVADGPVSECTNFTLSHLDHTVTLAFSQFNFDNPMNVIYEYRVNGGEWMRNPEGKNDFTLSHLQPGTYNIEVRALVGNAYTPVKRLTVTIRAPWYRSTVAYILYALLALSIIGLVLWFIYRRASEQMKEEKMKFLINATHDIRSPLTLIVGPLEKLKSAHVDELHTPEAIQQFNTTVLKPSVDTIEHNAKRILNLVNQILDVRKIDKQQMHLHCQQTDIVSFVRAICKMFEFNAKERNINFQFTADADHVDAWIDRSQFDKVVSNLLSNAFKYCNDGGEVAVMLTHDDSRVQLQVQDNGIGLDGDSLKHVFDRFYQGSNSRHLHIDGTGIGLNLCKMIVDMHHGNIEATNRTDGQRGAVFTVTLPMGNAHLTPEEIEKTPAATPAAPTIGQSPKPQASGHRVLIVDDDQELCHYISTELSRYYRFGICSNGREGLRELLTQDYDLVISDVMMPEMDGFTMLRMIKTNLNISHIPVIMLTSKADVANRLEGLERGADAFLAKPFDMEELHMNIDNLIHSRQRLKGKYSGAQQQADKIEQPEVKGNDELLMERIMKAVNKNLSNSDFNVDMLTQEVGISRAQLHRKMKEMTGISTSEFIRNLRLEQAARLLKEQKINVTQVAYTVGFSNLAHFSTIFRKHFGLSPSEYAENAERE